MKPDRLGGFICCIIIMTLSFLFGLGLYQFINYQAVKVIFAIYCIFAFFIDVLAVIFFSDDDNLM